MDIPLEEQPALEPPPGESSNFSDDGGRQDVGFAILTIGIIISTASVISRFVSRHSIRQFGLVELFLFAAWGQYLGFQANMYKGVIFPGIGRHQWNLRLVDVEYTLYHVHIGTLLYGTCMMCLKLAILIDWMHLFVPDKKRNAFFWSIQFLIWANVIFYVAGEFADIFQCIPMEKIWNPFFEGGHCPVDAAAHNFSAALINLASDIAIFLLPQWKIWRLNMTLKKKVGVAVVFTAGVLVTVLGGLRMHALLPLIDSDDQVYWITILGVYSSAELGVGFLILGLPCLPKVFKVLPFSESLVRLVRSLRTASSEQWTQMTPNATWGASRQGSQGRKRRGPWEITELEETELRTQGMTTVDDQTAVQPEQVAVKDSLDQSHTQVKTAPIV